MEEGRIFTNGRTEGYQEELIQAKANKLHHAYITILHNINGVYSG